MKKIRGREYRELIKLYFYTFFFFFFVQVNTIKKFPRVMCKLVYNEKDLYIYIYIPFNWLYTNDMYTRWISDETEVMTTRL